MTLILYSMKRVFGNLCLSPDEIYSRVLLTKQVSISAYKFTLPYYFLSANIFLSQVRKNRASKQYFTLDILCILHIRMSHESSLIILQCQNCLLIFIPVGTFLLLFASRLPRQTKAGHDSQIATWNSDSRCCTDVRGKRRELLVEVLSNVSSRLRERIQERVSIYCAFIYDDSSVTLPKACLVGPLSLMHCLASFLGKYYEINAKSGSRRLVFEAVHDWRTETSHR